MPQSIPGIPALAIACADLAKHDSRRSQNEYSDWLEIAYPAEHETLFEDQLMLVFTEQNRERHRQLLTEWAAGFES